MQELLITNYKFFLNKCNTMFFFINYYYVHKRRKHSYRIFWSFYVKIYLNEI